MYDFHCHTTYSDGELIPSELIRRMAYTGYTEMGIADHADFSNIEELVAAQKRVKRSAEQYGIRLFTGVELTHVPPKEIDELAHLAKSLGAEIVIVHGETTAEPVAEGTNHAALSSDAVDILAHPGLITEADAKLAAENNIFLEITARGGHNRTNGHIVTLGRRAGAAFVIQSDIHSPDDIIGEDLRYIVARGAGMTEEEAKTALSLTAENILNR